jgi:MFS family permease
MRSPSEPWLSIGLCSDARRGDDLAQSALAYIGFGTLSDRIGRDRAFYLGAAAQIVALALLLGLPNQASLGYIYGYALLWGIGKGSRSGLLTAITSDYFSGSHLGSIVGTLGPSSGLGQPSEAGPAA